MFTHRYYNGRSPHTNEIDPNRIVEFTNDLRDSINSLGSVWKHNVPNTGYVNYYQKMMIALGELEEVKADFEEELRDKKWIAFASMVEKMGWEIE